MKILSSWQTRILPRKNKPDTLRNVIEDYIENGEDTLEAQSEQSLISNVLQLSDLTADDVMIPRAEIVAIAHDITRDNLITFIKDHPLSRFPVFKDNLDTVLGTVHIKDLFLAMAPDGAQFKLHDLIRDIPVISPALPVLDILQLMRQSRKHMVIVVDEFGGTDGLVTAGDVIEAIIGQLDDEHAQTSRPTLIEHSNGKIYADARLDIDDFQKEFDITIDQSALEDVDTLGGFVMAVAGRIPVKGEIIKHEASGFEFEIIAATPKQVKRVSIIN